MNQRATPITSVNVIIQIIKGNAIQQCKCVSSCFLSSTVIDFQYATSTPDVDTTFGKRRKVFINSLVRITYNKNIIRLFITNDYSQ